MVEELVGKGWTVTLLAEEFCGGGDRREEAQKTQNGMALNTSSAGAGGRSPDVDPEPNQLQRVRLPAFFRRGIFGWPRKFWEVCRVWKLITNTPGAVVIVQGDLPRVVYLLLQLWVPLLFIRQDATLTCPGNNRFLQRSRLVCGRPLGVSCLWVHRKEGCLGALSLPQQLGRLAFRVRDGLLLRWLGHFVVNSRYTALIHRRPSRVVYPPRRSGTENWTAPERDRSRLVFCGRLEETKGPGDAIRILSLLPQRFHLEVLGDGPERGCLAALAEELQVGQRVTFHGWVDAVRRDKLLASAGVLLMPSLWAEAFGMAGLEALAQGTPVVAYDVGGISEWCSANCGVLVPCGDVAAAASAARQLTEDPGRWATHSEAAKRVALNTFPASRFGVELEELLREVLAGSAGVPPAWRDMSKNELAGETTALPGQVSESACALSRQSRQRQVG
jgi:glycosyltransferase involved in cell wall biosynthesis